MTASALALLLAIAAGAAYLQTVTGFGLGLVLMGAIGLTRAITLPDAAVLVSVFTIVNAVQVLRHANRDVAWREFALVMLCNLPALAGGYLLLNWLAGSRIEWLRLILGLAVIGASLQLALSPAQGERPSGAPSFALCGIASGLMAGLFSTAGPPLVYHFYRQPMPMRRIRDTLIGVFGLNAALRLAMVAAGGALSWRLAPGLLAVPVIAATTSLARRFPPPLSPAMFRRVVFVLLLASGLALAGPSAAILLKAVIPGAYR